MFNGDYYLKVSEYIGKYIYELGVKEVFTVAATQIYPLLRDMIKAGIRVINSKSELGAAFMSLVYSRITRKPGVLTVVAGPGIMGSMLPISCAMTEGDPLLILSNIPKNGKFTRVHQMYRVEDQLALLRIITKLAYRVERKEELAHVLTKAYSTALSNRPGPTYVEIPDEMFTEEIEAFQYITPYIEKPGVSSDLLKEVIDLLTSAELPVILAGRGVYISNAEKDLLTTAEILGSPVVVSIMGKGVISPDHPLYAGVAAGGYGNITAQKILEEADVVLAIGNRFSEIGTGRYSLKITGKLIHVNIDPNEIGRAYKPYIGIISDAKIFLEMLNKELMKAGVKGRRDTKEYIKHLWEKEYREMSKYYTSTSKNNLIESWEAVKAIRDLASKDAYIICDVGAHRRETILMPIYTPGTYITSTSFDTMGIAVPGAVATSIVYPDKQVIGIVGDGGFLMTGTEILTALEHNAKPIIIVFNDSSYRQLRINEKLRLGTDTPQLYKLPPVDFSMIAHAMKIKGYTIASRNELYPILEEAFNWNRGPVIVDIKINPESITIPERRLYGL